MYLLSSPAAKETWKPKFLLLISAYFTCGLHGCREKSRERTRESHGLGLHSSEHKITQLHGLDLAWMWSFPLLSVVITLELLKYPKCAMLFFLSEALNSPSLILEYFPYHIPIIPMFSLSQATSKACFFSWMLLSWQGIIMLCSCSQR